MTDKARTISPLSGNINFQSCSCGIPVLGINREHAARLVGISPSLFDRLVKDGRMPKPFNIDARVVWDIRKIIHHFDLLSKQEVNTGNPWDGD